MLVGGGDHDDVGPFGRFLVGKHLEAGGLGLFGGGRAGAECDRDFLHAAVAHVLRVGVALAAIPADGDLLPLDYFLVGFATVITLHVCFPYGSDDRLFGTGVVSTLRFRWSPCLSKNK